MFETIFGAARVGLFCEKTSVAFLFPSPLVGEGGVDEVRAG
jgi:hypothetical protein